MSISKTKKGKQLIGLHLDRCVYLNATLPREGRLDSFDVRKYEYLAERSGFRYVEDLSSSSPKRESTDVNIVILLLAFICHLRSWCSHVQLVLEAQQQSQKSRLTQNDDYHRIFHVKALFDGILSFPKI